MSKGLEALNKIKKFIYYESVSGYEDIILSIEKELKALESIKVILKDLIEFNEIDLPHIDKVIYEIKICDKAIYSSKEKYNLLKEVLL